MRTKIAKQYASGLFELAKELQAIDVIQADLEAVVAIVREHPEIRHFVNQPRIPIDKKKALFAEVYKVIIKTVNPVQTDHRQLVQDFVNLLLDKGRVQHLQRILNEYERLMRDYRDILLAHVVTAVDLETDLADKLTKKLEALTGKKIELAHEVDPGILGGMILRIKDWQIDGSVSSGLNRLRDNILAAKPA